MLYPPTVETILKINISWQRYYPACSTTPWQLEGVIRTLQQDGYQKILPAQNGTVVVDSHEGEVKNKHKAVLDKYGLQSLHLTDKGVQWVTYEPKGEMLVLDKVFPEGIRSRSASSARTSSTCRPSRPTSSPPPPAR